ncbi:hypothetical protein Tco_0873922 [Tanacetum coccineum]|uniref:Uncharacterized protein n=1 Tax=Tanacetum coccineum TaxID=301880 RepID=A0ABQ5BK75_9ASTR
MLGQRATPKVRLYRFGNTSNELIELYGKSCIYGIKPRSLASSWGFGKLPKGRLLELCKAQKLQLDELRIEYAAKILLSEINQKKSDFDVEAEVYRQLPLQEQHKFLALGWHLEEIHVTWAHLEKKQTRLRTYTKSLKESCSQIPHHVLDLWSLTQLFYDHVDDYTRMDLDFAAAENLRELSGEKAWEAIENFTQGQKEWDNPPNIISEQEVANLKAQAKRLFGNENVLVEMHRGITWDKVENLYLQSSPQVLLSFEEHTPPVTYQKEVEETLGTPIEVIFDEKKLGSSYEVSLDNSWRTI